MFVTFLVLKHFYQCFLKCFSSCIFGTYHIYSKTYEKRPLSKRPKIGFQDQLSLNAGQKYCRMPQGEHSAILLTFIKLPFVIKIFALSIFEWLFYTGFTVQAAKAQTSLRKHTTSPEPSLVAHIHVQKGCR